ncbi:MAG: cobalamin-binding protein [Planctomycetota bacterium]|nr:MAG: cobalamin-binding protein [Planctomycetota bacterium]
MMFRIASLLASGTEIVCALGLRDRLVAISHECDFPPAVGPLPRVTRTVIDAAASGRAIDEQVRGMCTRGKPLYQIDVKRLADLRPDVIITQAQCDVCAVRFEDVRRAVESTPALNVCRVVALNPTRLEHLYSDIRAVAVACNASSAGKSLVAALQSRVSDAARRAHMVCAETHRPRVACMEWIDPLMIAANWMPDLVDLAGGQCDLTNGGAHSTCTDWSVLRAFDPQVIVVMPCGFDLDRAVAESSSLLGMPGWPEIAAVREGRVFAVDGNALFNRSGPRMVDSLELLAGLIHGGEMGDFRAKHSWAWRRLVGAGVAAG